MKKFLYLYAGGQTPEGLSKAEIDKAMNAWVAYYAKLGDKIVDGGSPLGERQTVGGVAATMTTGYTFVKAPNLKAAVAMTKGHPHLAGGGTIEVLEVMPQPGM